MTKNRILNLLKVAVSLGLSAVLLSRIDAQQVLRLVEEMDRSLFLVALLLLLSGSLVRAFRWGILVRSLGVPASARRLVRLYFVGAFFSLFLPTGIGGDAVKMYELARNSPNPAAAINTVLVDRFLGLAVLATVAQIALLFGHRLVELPVRVAVSVLFAAIWAVLVLVWQRRWLEWGGRILRIDRLLGRARLFRELYHSLHQYRPAALLQAVGASAAWNLILIGGYYLLGQAVGVELSLWAYILVVPVVSVLIMVPSVGGLGVREGGTVILFGQVGVDEPHAMALALAFDLTLLAAGLIGAVLYIVQGLREARR